MGRMTKHETQQTYLNIKKQAAADTLNEENFPEKADTLGKPQLLKKLSQLTKYSEKFLRKHSEDQLRAMYSSLLAKGRAKVVADLKGETSED